MKFEPEVVLLALMPFVGVVALIESKEAAKATTIHFELPATKPFVPKNDVVNFASVKKAGINKVSNSFLDFSGNIPDQANVDWNKALTKLWKRKLAINHVSPATKKSGYSLVARYNTSNIDKMSITHHIEILGPELNKIRSNTDWKAICNTYHLRDKQCSAFQAGAKLIDAKMMTGYSMTEIGYYPSGEQNYAMMDLYMRHAGRNYLDAIPSLGDPLLSVGRYQFTSYAVGRDESGPRSANKLAKFTKGYHLPESVVSLKGLDNDRAAFYFASFNLMNLARNMNDTEADVFKRQCMSRKGLVQYIATAHHNPKWAQVRAMSWIDHGCFKDLLTYQGPELKKYSQKTLTNYEAVVAHNR